MYYLYAGVCPLRFRAGFVRLSLRSCATHSRWSFGTLVPAQVLLSPLGKALSLSLPAPVRRKARGRSTLPRRSRASDRPPFRQIRFLRCLGQGWCFALSFIIYYYSSAFRHSLSRTAMTYRQYRQTVWGVCFGNSHTLYRSPSHHTVYTQAVGGRSNGYQRSGEE